MISKILLVYVFVSVTALFGLESVHIEKLEQVLGEKIRRCAQNNKGNPRPSVTLCCGVTHTAFI